MNAVAISTRDATVLRVVGDLAGPDGWAKPRARGQLLDASGLSRTSWQRAVAALVDGGLLESSMPEGCATFRSTPNHYRLTPEGVAALAAAGPREPSPRPAPVTRAATRVTVGRGPGHESGPPLRETLTPGESKTKSLTLSSSSGGPGRDPGHGGPRPAGHGDLGHDAGLWLSMPEDSEARADLLQVLADFYRRCRAAKLPQSAPAPTPEPVAKPEPAPAAPATTPPPVAQPAPAHAALNPWRGGPPFEHAPPAALEAKRHAALGRIREAWQHELGLPTKHLVGAEREWAHLHAGPGPGPELDAVLAGLRRESPAWHSRAVEQKAKGQGDPWRFVPRLGTWLGGRGWEAQPDPAPRATTPAELPTEVREEIRRLVTKAEAAERRGDADLGKTYRDQIKRIRETGRVT